MTYMRLPAYKDGTLAATTTSQQVMDSNSTGHDGLKYTITCLLYTSPSPRDRTRSRMPSSA